MNRIEKIKAFKDAQTISAMEETMKEELEVAKCKMKVAKLRPRIAELIETANVCLASDIQLNRALYEWCRGIGQKHGYGTFISNGFTHKVGFIQGNGCQYDHSNDEIKFMGIVNGGAFGKWDFYTDGVEVFSIHEDSHEVNEPSLEHLRKFLSNFDKFEKEFYEYVDRITESF